ncbi:MAG: TIM barrel protein [Hyphomicrobiales bacterium]|nr:TIM barrel protein [Hyphomicrobiales bacterium]MDE2115795.1 TIM barrel protein [Hyphomicrobiales bacterium]
MTLNFALNHMVAPSRDHQSFFDLAQQSGLKEVEIRNDLDGVALKDGTPAVQVGADAKKRGLSIISINALQKFNLWNDARAEEARELARYARDCGAQALVLCPVNDVDWQPEANVRLQYLRVALLGLAPILREFKITGLVEPLGFVECSLRLKREAVEAIDATGTAEVFKLVHDTFHHVVAGETDMFPQRTGLVHISGVEDANVPVTSMRDMHRVFVGQTDFIDNVRQMRQLLAAGYRGPFSFEPFARQVHELSDIGAAVSASCQLIENELLAKAK